MIFKFGKSVIRTVFLFVLVISLNSCLSYYYVPNSHNVPLFQDKKEVRVTMGGSMGENFGGAEIQGAYSLTKHIGIMANGFFNSQGYYSGGGYFVEIGSGYFKSFNSKIVFETYGGFGFGETTNLNILGAKSWVNYSRYFIQPSIAYASENFDIAFSSRFCGLDFRDVDDLYLLDKEPLSTFSYLFEPALTVRGGWQLIKFQFQIGYSENLNNPTLMQEKFNFNIGISISIIDENKPKHKIHKQSQRINKHYRKRNSSKD